MFQQLMLLNRHERSFWQTGIFTFSVKVFSHWREKNTGRNFYSIIFCFFSKSCRERTQSYTDLKKSTIFGNYS